MKNRKSSLSKFKYHTLSSEQTGQLKGGRIALVPHEDQEEIIITTDIIDIREAKPGSTVDSAPKGAAIAKIASLLSSFWR